MIVLLHKERFSVGKYHKLQPMKHGRYKILQRINPNAYVVDLLSCMGISRIFNVSGLYFYSPFRAAFIYRFPRELEGEVFLNGRDKCRACCT